MAYIWDGFMTMVTKSREFRNLAHFFKILGISTCLVWTASSTASAQADARSGGFRFPGLTTNTPEPPEWIRKTRPPADALYGRDYVPGVEPERAPLNPDQLRKVEAEMNALKARHDRVGGRPKSPAGRSAAADPKPKPGPRKPNCVLTCNIGLGSVRGK